jgi:hypothetical protein
VRAGQIAASRRQSIAKASDDPILDAARVVEPYESEFVIVGDSHIFAIGAAQDYAGPLSLIPVDAAFSHSYFLMAHWQRGRRAQYRDGLVSHSKAEPWYRRLWVTNTLATSCWRECRFSILLIRRIPAFPYIRVQP